MAPAYGPSLARRQTVVMLIALGVVAAILGLGGAWFIRDFAERTSDRVLMASVSAIAETVSLERDAISVEVPPASLSALENSRRDNIYYNVTTGGRLVTGYPELHVPDARSFSANETAFRYDTCRGQAVRVGLQVRRLPGVAEPVVIQVAETLDERWALSLRMLLGLVALEILLVIVAAMLVWPAVRWGLRPVTSLQRELAERPAEPVDFAPLASTQVPAELRALVDGFNGLLGRLEGAVGGLRRFTADASHQMRTPLAVLRTHLTILKRSDVHSAEQEASLKDIEEACDRLEHLLSQLLRLARAENRSASGEALSAVDLTAIAANVARDLARTAVEAGREIVFECNDEVMALAEEIIVSEILTNLIDNAVRYTDRGGTVWVKVHCPDGVPTVEIEDDGPGIPPEERSAVFNRFYRLRRHQNANGSGLGLPIVGSLCETIGASIELTTGRTGRGLLAHLTFGSLNEAG